MIVCATLDDAVEVLKEQGIQTTTGVLEVWRDREPAIRERYQQRRQELAPQLEGKFANDLLDNGRRGTLAVRLAVEETIKRLEDGTVADPSKAARDISQVVAQSVDKRLAIQGWPTQIVEHRDVNEILRQLVALGVVTIDDTVDGTAEDDDGPLPA
jgi:siroheme synthase (precorrin-2 oxidase/ferrochelatase)